MPSLTREHINEIIKLYKHLPDELDETLNIESGNFSFSSLSKREILSDFFWA
jgi:hypothetical protein